MFHLLVMVCIADGPCVERWLPAADQPDQPACEASSAAVATPWAQTHGLTITDSRCVETSALPALSLEPIATGVWVHRGADQEATPDNGGAIANLGVIEGPDGIAVIDAGGSRAEGERFLAAIRQMTDKPVSAVVLTHLHPDHILGAEPFAEAGATIIADQRLPQALSSRIDAYSTIYRDSIGDAAWIGSAFIRPDILIAGSETHSIGGTHLRLRSQPSAHTSTDLTVYHPESRTLFTGDLLFRQLTPVLDGSLKGWLEWLGAEPMPTPALIVPGHGPVADGWPQASGPTHAYLAALAAAVRGMIDDNVALSAAVPAILAAMAPLAEDWADFDGTTRRNAAAAYHELEWD